MPIQPADIRFDPQGNALSETFGDIYFNPDDAPGKTQHLFHRPTHFDQQLAALPEGQPLVVGELGFGLGLNFLGTWSTFLKVAPPRSRLHYVGIDLAPPSSDQLRRALWGFDPWRPQVEQLLDEWPGRVAGVHRLWLEQCELTLHLGAVNEMLTGVTGAFDAWFLDGFSPEKNPGMWEPALWKQLFGLTRSGGRVGSYTAAGHVRRGLAEAGFDVERLPGDPFKRHILAAVKPPPPPEPRETADDRDASDARRDSGLARGQKNRGRVVVVGAGWAGLRVAEALNRRGHAVTVVDAGDEWGAGASGNLQAVVAPVLDAAASPRQDFYRSAFVLAQRNVQTPGVLRVADTQKNADALRQAAEVFGGLDDELTWREDPDGLWMQSAGVVSFAEQLKASHKRCRIPFVEHFSLTRLSRIEDLWRLESSDGRAIETDLVVLACAAAVTRFSQTADWPLQQIRGQVSHVRATAASASLNHSIVGEAYLCPVHEGRHSVGATFDPAPGNEFLDFSVRSSDHDDNQRRARLTAPDIAGAMDWSDVTGRVGFRCNSPDYLPMIGAVPDVSRWRERFGESTITQPIGSDDACATAHPGLFAVTALGSHGVISSALAGTLIADLIDDTPLPCSATAAAAVNPDRYLRRAVKRRQPIGFPAVDENPGKTNTA